MPETHTSLVQLRVRPGTIAKVNELKEWLESPNRTAAVVTAIGIAHAILRAVREGKIVYAEDKTGREKLIIPDAHEFKQAKGM